MKIRFLKLKDWLLMTIMGTLGMAGCHGAKDFAKEPVAPEPDYNLYFFFVLIFTTEFLLNSNSFDVKLFI